MSDNTVFHGCRGVKQNTLKPKTLYIKYLKNL